MKLSNHINWSIILKIVTILIVVGSFSQESKAQSFLLKNDYDTNYIHSATEELTSRLLSSISYTDILFRDQKLNTTLSYSIHSRYRFGIGFNYSVFGINLTFSPFNNSANNAKYGETKSIDLRMNLYGRSVIFDLYLIKHKGFYLSNPESVLEIWPYEETYPLRPDISVFSTGLVTQYIFNNKKFSLRATYLQNEWQKKSSGSVIVGAALFYSLYNADSSFIPKNIKHPDFLGGLHFNHSSSINFGINGGYSHTFVLKQHFFLSAGLTVGPQFIYTALKCDSQTQASKYAGTFGINALFRTGFGYNSKKIYAGVFFISENLANATIISDATTLMSVGIFKLNFVYRFTLNKPIKFLNPNYWKFLQPKENR
ncbi:MAG: DUF4421 family protein [Bacteroidota bacterium]